MPRSQERKSKVNEAALKQEVKNLQTKLKDVHRV